MQQPTKGHLIWIDLEMTGLNCNQDKILEIATVITDSELNIIAEGPEIAIFQSDEILQKMDDWNTEHHTKSGLVQRVKQSHWNESQAEQATLEFLKQFVAPQQSPMTGNSICQDRRFLHRHMPQLEAFFHYRNLDVSTVKELAMRWYPDLIEKLKKESKHRAKDDILESIEELRFYKKYFFIHAH